MFTEEQLANKRLEPYKRRLASIVLEDYKYIWGSDGRDELYRLTDDPTETRNLAGDPGFDRVRLELMKLLEQTVNGYASTAVRDSTDPHQKLDQATEKALKSLGYLR